MAAVWIKMRVDLDEDPAVIAMAEILGLDEFAVVGRLHSLWSWADGQSRDGHASGVTEKWIDRRMRCDGFAAAMVKVGWIVFTSDGLNFPHFDRHNGETAKQRGLAANRQQKKRTSVTQQVTDMSRNERDDTGTDCVTREEKRREEEIGNSSTSVETEVSAGEVTTRAQCAKRLRSLGMLDVHPGRAELFEILRDGFTEQVLADTAAELASKKGGKPPNLNFLIATVRGRRADAAAQRQQPTGKPSITDNFQDAHYVGTPVEQLPPEFREAVSGLG